MTNINQNQKTQGNKSLIKNMKEKMNVKINTQTLKKYKAENKTAYTYEN